MIVKRDRVDVVSSDDKPMEVVMARTMNEQRIREKMAKLEAQMEAEKNRLLSIKNANVDVQALVGWSEMRQMVYTFHQEHRVPYVKVLEALVKSDIGDGYVLKVSKPRGPRKPKAEPMPKVNKKGKIATA